MKFVNLTPHAITLQRADGSRIDVPPDGRIARVASTPGNRVADIDGVSVYNMTEYEGLIGLPDSSPGIGYIVAGMCLLHVVRADVFAPGTGPGDGAIRNDKGQIAAVTRLIRAI